MAVFKSGILYNIYIYYGFMHNYLNYIHINTVLMMVIGVTIGGIAIAVSEENLGIFGQAIAKIMYFFLDKFLFHIHFSDFIFHIEETWIQTLLCSFLSQL